MNARGAWWEGSEDPVALRALIEVSADGLLLLGKDGRILTMNSAAREFFGPGNLVGQVAPFWPSDTHVDSRQQPGSLRSSWMTQDGRRRVVEYRIADLSSGRRVVWFSDVTESERHQERLTAISRAASSVADGYSLKATLDAVANEILMTANISAVQILVVEDPHDELRVMGMAGFGAAADFTERLSECRRRGARVRFVEALERREPVVVPHRKPRIMADPAWEPLHDVMGALEWESFAAMPLVVRGRARGVINAFYLPGEAPGSSSLAFLEAMADHAAVAIDTSALLYQTRSQAEMEERRRLSRELHDSAVQQVFSMGMQARALAAQLDGVNHEGIRVGAEELVKLSKSALADLRALVFELRPLDLVGRGLVDAVREHAADLEARSGLEIEVECDTDLLLDFGVEVQEDLYRIVQEALHNVVKHARANKARVVFSAATDGTALTMEVTDDGLAAEKGDSERGDEPKSLGLLSMRERSERWGGHLVAGPRPGGGGWAVTASVPLLRGYHAKSEARS